MPETQGPLSLEDVIGRLPDEARKVVLALHQVALDNGCHYRVRPGDASGKHEIVYSAMSYCLRIDGPRVTLVTAYDIRAFLDYYRHQADETAQALLFNAAAPCEYCIDDKCTTLISDHTIAYQGKRKKLCGPYRHWLVIADITLQNLPAVQAIAAMAFRYCTPAMHTDLFYENEVSYRTEDAPEITILGFRYAAASFGVKIEDFIRECLAPGEDGKRRIDTLIELTGQADSGRYIGVTTDFLTSTCYHFTFGIACPRASIPSELPQGVAIVRVQAGPYAVYNTSAGDYRSVWQRFNEAYYDAERKGYDTSRVPYEYYDRDGRFGDVHIPVSADCPKDSGRRTRVLLTPDIRLAGISTCSENDHPFYQDVTGLQEKLLEYFPHAERVMRGWIHAKPGWPMTEFTGVEVDALDVIPPELEIITIRGGYWNVVAYPYFRSGEFEIFSTPYRPRFEVDLLAHPRAFLELYYTGRGLYSEVYTPIRLMGERRVELVERPVTLLIGKEEAPPASVVTAADMRAFYDLDANVEKGRCVLAYHFELHRGQYYFQKPVIKGAEVADIARVPAGMQAFTLEGGRYVRLSETLPNGELDWSLGGYAFKEMEKETGYQLDLSRLFIVEQMEYGRAFALYVPVK